MTDAPGRHRLAHAEYMLRPDRLKEPSRWRRQVTAATTIWGHIGGVLGAVGLAALTRDFGVDWRGAIGHIIDIWATIARPVGHSIIAVLVYPSELLLDWHFQVPTWLSDYAAVGVVLGFAMVRAERRAWTQGDALVRLFVFRRKKFFWHLPVWPYLLLFIFPSILIQSRRRFKGHREAWKDDDGIIRNPKQLAMVLEAERWDNRYVVFSILPLIYFTLLFLASQILPR